MLVPSEKIIESAAVPGGYCLVHFLFNIGIETVVLMRTARLFKEPVRLFLGFFFLVSECFLSSRQCSIYGGGVVKRRVIKQLGVSWSHARVVLITLLDPFLYTLQKLILKALDFK